MAPRLHLGLVRCFRSCLDRLRVRGLFGVPLERLLRWCELASALISLILLTAHSRTLSGFDMIICMLMGIERKRQRGRMQMCR